MSTREQVTLTTLRHDPSTITEADIRRDRLDQEQRDRIRDTLASEFFVRFRRECAR